MKAVFSPFNAICSSTCMRAVLLFVWAGLAVSGVALGQSKSNSADEQTALRASEAMDSQMERAAREWRRTGGLFARKGGQAPPLSFRNFVRGGIMTGNLMQVPYVTNVNVAAGYWGSTVSPNKMIWPRGSGVEYGHTMSFIVGGKVTSEAGDTLTILSESYNRGGGDAHPSGSHKYFWSAVPGYYNMQGDRGTSNQLNNNEDDRALLASTGKWFVGGLNEDANGNGVLDAGEDLNANGQLDTELANRQEYPAQSNLRETWPAFWPPGSYVGDDRAACVSGQPCQPLPGTREGRWNGEFGSFVRGDQEAYYVADDRDNDEFPYFPFLNPETGGPDTRDWANGGRRGLGLETTIRHYQWASVVAEDIFIGTFDVENVADRPNKDIDEAIISMIVDYDVADQTSQNEAFFDTADDITYQWLKRDLVINGFRVGYVGVGFLESPGIADDGRDNDADGMIDESRSNNVDDDGDWRTWVDVNGNGTYDNEDLNNNFRLDPGEDRDGNGRLDIEPIFDDVGSDGVGPEQEDYPGPDPDGTEANGRPDPGEPNFEFTDNDEIDQIGLTNMVIRTPSEFDRDLDDDEVFWDEYIQPVAERDFIVPSETADVIYVYSSGLSRIAQGERQRFALAWLAGNDFEDMLRNKRTMQNIYDADYNFAKAPNTPFLTAVPGDKRVTLAWDQSSENSRDPIYGNDFEMYKVYRSTDPEFNDIKTITDAFGNPLLWEPLRTPTGGRVQFDLDNGLRGAHPVTIPGFGVSYDMGTDSGLSYSYVDSTVENGRTYYYAVVSVDQGYHGSFFPEISPFEALADITPTESSKVIEVDAFDRPTNVDRNTAVVIPQPPALGYVAPHLMDGGVQRTSGNSSAALDVQFLVPDEANALQYEYEFAFTDDASFEELDNTLLRNGLTTGFTLRNVTTGTVLAVSEPGARGRTVFESDVLRARLYDGMRLTIDNPPVPEPINTGWLDNDAPGSRGSRTPRTEVSVSAQNRNIPVPNDYEIRIEEAGADTSNSLSPTSRIPVNFTVWDVTDLQNQFQVPFQLTEASRPVVPGDSVRGQLSPGDVLNLRVSGVNFQGFTLYTTSTWQFQVGMSAQSEALVGDVLTRSNVVYDSLVARAVPGFDTRPFGNDISAQSATAFLELLAPIWGVNPDVSDLTAVLGSAPAEHLAALSRIAETEIPRAGDVFLLETSKPLDRDDVIRFRVDGNRDAEQVEESALENIYVVPDPYVAVNPLEARNIQLSGRGERRIDFRNLPREATITIFTMSGRQVKVIRHAAGSDQSFATWNLQSDDGLDVAFGVYMYHVDAPGIGSRVGRFSIIK